MYNLVQNQKNVGHAITWADAEIKARKFLLDCPGYSLISPVVIINTHHATVAGLAVDDANGVRVHRFEQTRSQGTDYTETLNQWSDTTNCSNMPAKP